MRTNVVTEGTAMEVRGGVDVGELFDAHAPGLYAYLARRVGAGLAEDLVADTFEAAVRQWTSYDAERGSPRAWLYGIATNLVRRHARTEQRGYAALTRLARADGGGEPDDVRVAERVDASVRVRQLAGVLAELSPADRDVLLLTAWAQLGAAEVAAALAIPVGTVRSRLHRVRRWVRTHAPHEEENR